MRYTQRDCEGAVIRLAVATKTAVLCFNAAMAKRAKEAGAKVARYATRAEAEAAVVMAYAGRAPASWK